MDADGRNVRMLSSSAVHDNTPAVLPDGRVLYTRWEYVDRSQVEFHHLWTMNPDGTGQMVFYGNLHPGVHYDDRDDASRARASRSLRPAERARSSRR